jgi:peptidoglycan/xylan/chitin deacetylase (PgdA/CDA1 family)
MDYIYRNDGVCKDTSVKIIKHIHNQFLNHHKTHTISVICEGLEKNKELVDYINKTHNWDICIQGWEHTNYCLQPKEKIADDLDWCILKIEKLFGVVPKKWYLPWNGWTRTSGFDKVPFVADIAFYHGVDVDTDCDHIAHFIELIESGRNPVTDTVYFDSCKIEDLKLLPTLLYLTRKK